MLIDEATHHTVAAGMIRAFFCVIDATTGRTGSKQMGKVYLIGAGPGAADLITVRGARLLGEADVVLHDALVEPAMLDYAPATAEVRGGRQALWPAVYRAAVHQQADCRCGAGARSRRAAKGGDPMLFGRADEEMRALEAAGIDYEVVPGITAALAGAASLQRSAHVARRGAAAWRWPPTRARPAAMPFASR